MTFKKQCAIMEAVRKGRFVMDTQYFHYFNANPKRKATGDCVIRALSLATGKSWADILRMLCDISVITGYMVEDTRTYDKLLMGLGWLKQRQPRKPDNTKYTGREFCEKLEFENRNEKIIAHIGGHHMTCFCNHTIWDTWDCSRKCIGNYWIKR